MSEGNKWNSTTREYMYRRILDEFGKAKSWENIHSPVKRDSTYEKFKQKLTKFINENLMPKGKKVTPDALRFQINWAVKSPPIISKRGDAFQWIQNKSSALDAKFIDYTDLPDIIFCIHKDALTNSQINEFINYLKTLKR